MLWSTTHTHTHTHIYIYIYTAKYVTINIPLMVFVTVFKTIYNRTINKYTHDDFKQALGSDHIRLLSLIRTSISIIAFLNTFQTGYGTK